MEEWVELEALVLELEQANEGWSNTIQAMRQQIESFAAVADAVEQHYRELGVEDALRAISTRALGDAARLHAARLNFGLTRSAALIWFPMDDPRADLSMAPPEGQYSLEVRIGPRYLLGADRDRGAAGDQRLSILIAGAKQLIATLPTAPEKFRAALLVAFRSPGYGGPPREDATAPSQQAAEPSAAAEEGPAYTGPTGAAEAPTEPPAGASTDTGTNVEAGPGENAAETAGSQEPPAPETEPEGPAAVPDSDTPIELPGTTGRS